LLDVNRYSSFSSYFLFLWPCSDKYRHPDFKINFGSEKFQSRRSHIFGKKGVYYYCHDSNVLLIGRVNYIVAEKGFKVLTVKEKYYKKVRDYYRNIVEGEIDSVAFINEARILQEEMKENKITNLDPLKVKQIWKDTKI
jgi:hypothetical protein